MSDEKEPFFVVEEDEENDEADILVKAPSYMHAAWLIIYDGAPIEFAREFASELNDSVNEWVERVGRGKNADLLWCNHD